MKIGFIGTGNISAAMVTGLCTAQPAPEQVLVSPRNAKTAAALADRFPMVRVASDNQAVVDGSDWVVLAVRPAICRDVLAGLHFRADQGIISVIASLTSPELAELVSPAARIARAVPLPPCARHVGPIALCPGDDPVVSELLGRIGTVVAVEDDHRFDALNATTALMSAFFKFQAVSAEWLVEQGVETESARRYLASVFHAISRHADESGEAFDALADEAATPGGMNEQVARELTEAGSYDPLPIALDHILDRLEGRA